MAAAGEKPMAVDSLAPAGQLHLVRLLDEARAEDLGRRPPVVALKRQHARARR